MVENRRRPSPLAEAEVGRRSALLSQGGNAAGPGRSFPERSSPDHRFMGLVLIADDRAAQRLVARGPSGFAGPVWPSKW